MYRWLRALFINHPWVEHDDTRRECPVCGKTESRDIEVEILGPNPWFPVTPGYPERHFRKSSSRPLKIQVTKL